MEGSTMNTAMTTILSSATELLTWVLTSIGSLASTIVNQPLLLVGFLILFVSMVFGFFIRIAGAR